MTTAKSKKRLVQPYMFPAGEDLPLFTGGCVSVAVQVFAPQPVMIQDSLIDLRPRLGGTSGTVDALDTHDTGNPSDGEESPT